ncbi:hypothetical protein Ato02nite_074640 [Paractinoplanes toevensis]|uniref:Uncharacterized protein n=1 Tax=Paractinoplanes toevensis TaxID=571911 RepID=A0A919TIL3_9ACTN|nr:hypothetical protein Ato02nite_074640 [Actinoplanes toevensis]
MLWETVTDHDCELPLTFLMRTAATYPCSQLAGTLSAAEKTSLRGRVVVGAAAGGLVVVFSGTGVCDDGRAEVRLGVGDDDRERERDGDGETTEWVGVGVADVAGASGTCGMDGRATDGWRAASAGPTARTATQTTSMTRTAAAALRTIRAGPRGRAECLAGNGPSLRGSRSARHCTSL